MAMLNPGEIGGLPVDVLVTGVGRQSEMMSADMWNSLNDLQGALTILDESADRFAENPSQSKDKIAALNQEIAKNDSEPTFKEIKSRLRDQIRQQVAISVKSRAPDWIRDEVSRQVKEQVDIQIMEHLPETLQQQANESKRQLNEMRISLQNSESRLANSFIQLTNPNDPLAPILTSEGKTSPLYPPNTRCLFGYDLESAKGLNKDYELGESDDLSTNLQQFLKHIGTSVEVTGSGPWN